jgi:hypothetical protein
MFGIFHKTVETMLMQQLRINPEDCKKLVSYHLLMTKEVNRIVELSKNENKLLIEFYRRPNEVSEAEMNFTFELDMYNDWNLITFYNGSESYMIGLVEHGRYYRSDEMEKIVTPFVQRATLTLRGHYVNQLENPSIGYFVVKTEKDMMYMVGEMPVGTELTVYSNSLIYTVKEGKFTGKDVPINNCRILRKIIKEDSV